jgi:V/A-type H+-transporting ATPase subunit F
VDYFFIGDPELVTAFRFIGIDGTAVRDADEATEVFRDITEGAGCRVLILTEEVADWLEEPVVELELSGRYPLVVEIPGIMGRLPNRKNLVELIRQAIGVHV